MPDFNLAILGAKAALAESCILLGSDDLETVRRITRRCTNSEQPFADAYAAVMTFLEENF